MHEITHPRDLAVLRHVGCFYLSLVPVLSRLYFGGKECGHILKKLEERQLLRVFSRKNRERTGRAGFVGGVSFVTLTGKGARLVGLPEERGGAFGNSSLHRSLATVFFCHADTQAIRFRLEPEDLHRLFGEGAPADKEANLVPHVISEERGGRCLYRVYVESSAHAASVLRGAKAHVEKCWQNPVQRRWLQDGKLLIVVLTATTQKAAHLTALLKRPGPDGDAPLADQGVRCRLGVSVTFVGGYLDQAARELLQKARHWLGSLRYNARMWQTA